MKTAVDRYIASVAPVEKSPPLDPPSRVIRLAPAFPEPAADSFLNRELCGRLDEVVGDAVGRLDASFSRMSPQSRKNTCITLLEVAFNMMGIEADNVGFSHEEREKTLRMVVAILKKWEESEKGESALKAAMDDILTEMKNVFMGNSMTNLMARNIESKVKEGRLADSFVKAVREEIERNVYYQITKRGMSKFGNDSATGLRRVRHLGFVQVSSNPVIAARAYEEFPELWDEFEDIVRANPQWQEEPDRCADDIALHGTITSLLPNLLVFRPLALLSDLHDGLVSYQLNPLNADDLQLSLRDAGEICSILREILYHYDAWLGWDPEKLGGRPNIVFKVAACAPVARDITIGLNERGIGSNNTVTYSVSQELTLLLAESEGMARAIKNGVLPSQVYQTNMEGRLEDYLREAEAERLCSELSDEGLDKLASEILPEVEGSRGEKIKAICFKRALKSLTDDSLVKAMVDAHGAEIREYLSGLEEAIQHSGVYVTRRVYKLFFSPENRARWRAYIQKEFDLSEEEAETVIDRIDMLPSSKRKADDTYLVLGSPNVTNTEFPSQQAQVQNEFLEEGFDLVLVLRIYGWYNRGRR